MLGTARLPGVPVVDRYTALFKQDSAIPPDSS